MIGCLQTHVRKQSIIALYFEFETILKLYNLVAWCLDEKNHNLKYIRFNSLIQIDFLKNNYSCLVSLD